MPSSSRITNVFLILLLWLTSGCASDRPPSGGPLDTTPLQVIFSDPAPSTVQVSTKRIQLTFNHAVSARQLLNSMIISPSIGAYDIAVSGKNVEIKRFRPLEQDRTYILTIDKKLRDNSGRTFATPYSIAFSTGAIIDNGIISGTVINTDCSPSTNALIVAFAERPETTGSVSLLQREPDYFIQTDSSGSFSLEHIAKGLYRIVAFNDRNGDLRINAAAEEIGLCSTAVLATGSSNLLFRLSNTQHKNDKFPSRATSNAQAPYETGSISGTCFASGQYVIVDASSLTASYRTTASRDRKGELHYSFPELPRGSYTISAFIPSDSKKPNPERQWNPGSIEPFQPAEPFGFYPEKVTVRPRWTTEHIDIRITTSK
jgi:uncharacterized protein (DUF2141 family)